MDPGIPSSSSSVGDSVPDLSSSPVQLRRSTRVSRPPDRGPMVAHEALLDQLDLQDSKEFKFPCCYLFDASSPASPSGLFTKEPASIVEALKSEERDSWAAATQQEIDSLKERDTWDLVELPRGRKVVDNTWVFKGKLGPTGEVLRYKARLCARGFSQTKGLDFDFTFSPVAAFRSLRILFALTARFSLSLFQLDVVAAFLNGKLDHEIFMKQPRGYEDGTPRVCRLNKAIYGLKQSSRLWNAELHSTLVDLDFRRCLSDPCLYIEIRGSTVIAVLVYVDDIIIATNVVSLYHSTLAALRAEYQLTEQPEVTWVLGWHVCYSPIGLFVSQSSFTLTLLRRFQMLDSSPVTTPGIAGSVGVPPGGPSSFTATQYREAVGSLLFLSNCTRPDIAFAVGIACRAMSDPKQDDWGKVKRILRYLVGTPQLGLWFRKQVPNASFVCGFSDADWGGDTQGRRSTSGYVCLVAGCLVSWSSRKQPIVALSTMEAEYVAMAHVAREVLSLSSLLSELGFDIGCVSIFVDNSPAVFVSQNPVVTQKSKHIDLRYHFIRDVVARGIVDFKWIPTNLQLADSFTKYLDRIRFLRLRGCLVGERATG